jgi:hypothetical protein
MGPFFTLAEQFTVLGALRRFFIANGGSSSTFDSLASSNGIYGSSPNWSAFFAALIAALPQILSFISALMALFGGGAALVLEAVKSCEKKTA